MLLILILLINNLYYVFAVPKLKDPLLNIETTVTNLSKPTGITFLNNDIIVIEQEGKVKLISSETHERRNIAHFDVNKIGSRGLLSVESNGKDIFFFFTDSSVDPIKNRVVKYSWNGNILQNPIVLIDLPALPGHHHQGGKLILDKNKDKTAYIYTVIGDLNNADLNQTGILQNNKSNVIPDDSGVIFRVRSSDGMAVENNPFANNIDFSKYFAYGIRNSFGIAIDPKSGILWETENGPESYDEINIVKPGFNSGWNKIMGPIDRADKHEKDLVMIHGSHYKDPVISWKKSIGLTDIEFLNSSKLGPIYYNNLFIGDYNNGNLYLLDINQKREDIDINQHPNQLYDRVVDSDSEASSIIFGTGFGGISDIETGPDGNLYVLSYDDGILYKIFKN
jgi:aldose sugar dehydrogenase